MRAEKNKTSFPNLMDISISFLSVRILGWNKEFMRIKNV